MIAGEPGFEWLDAGAYLASYAFELPLRDALDDPELDPVRRALAALGMGIGLDHGYLAAGELLEAMRLIADDRAADVPSGQGRGANLLRDILDTPGDDYQRSLWYAVSRCGIDAAAEHLAWLVATMYARGAMFRAIRDARVAMPLLPGGDR